MKNTSKNGLYYPWQDEPSFEYVISKVLEISEYYPNDPEIQDLASHFKPNREQEEWLIELMEKQNKLEPLCSWGKKPSELSKSALASRTEYVRIQKHINMFEERFQY